jgi:phage tail-like protein
MTLLMATAGSAGVLFAVLALVAVALFFATILGTPTSYQHRYRFLVQIDDFARAGFTKCSALEMEVAKVETWEGGALTAHKEPGRVTFADITLERGATNDEDCYNWFKDVVEAYKDAGRVSPGYYRNVDIVQMDRDGSVLRRWTLEEAWPTKFVAGEWDNEADEATVEMLTLTFRLPKQPTD